MKKIFSFLLGIVIGITVSFIISCSNDNKTIYPKKSIPVGQDSAFMIESHEFKRTMIEYQDSLIYELEVIVHLLDQDDSIHYDFLEGSENYRKALYYKHKVDSLYRSNL